MGFGIGIVLTIIIVSLVISWKSNSHKLGQAFYYMFLGLLLASLAPGLPKASNDFITSVGSSIQHMNTSK